MGSEVEACAECSQNCALIHRKNRDPSLIVSSFFKVMFGKHFSEVLIVPPAFARTHASLEEKNTYLEDSSGRKWNVSLCNINGCLFFQQGWYEFSLDHGIELGDFLVFNYIMGSHFVVQIYGKSACEKLTLPKSYQNKRSKTSSDSIARNSLSVSANEELPLKDSLNPFSVTQPDVIVIEREDDANTLEESIIGAGNIPSQVNVFGRTEVASKAGFLEDPCFKINRDTSFTREDRRNYLFDLSAFEMPHKKVDADKTSKLQLHGNRSRLVCETSQKAIPRSTSTDVKKHHAPERNTVASTKYDEAFLSRKKYMAPSSCKRVDTSLRSSIPQKSIGKPHTPEYSAAVEGRTRPVKLEPREFRRDIGGNAVANASLSVLGYNPNFIGKEATTKNGDPDENPKLTVKEGDDLNTIVKPEPVDLYDSSSVLAIKITCSVQPDSESFLELPERLPLKAVKQGAKLEQKLVLLRDSAGRLWPVMYHQKYGFKVLASGWQAFRNANNIQPGNECSFVVEDINEAIFRVQIRRD